MDLSIVTGAKDRPEGFTRLLDSIIKHTPPGWELIVADASVEPIVCNDPRVKLLREWPPQGPVIGYNKCFREARGEFVCWLNDDSECLPGWATEAISFLEKNPQIGIAALYFSDGYFPPGRAGVQQFEGMPYANFGVFRRTLLDEIERNEPRGKLGAFLDTLFMYGNDNSLCFRCLKLGYGIVGVPTAQVIHHRPLGRAPHAEGSARRHEDYERLMREFRPHLESMRTVYAATSVRLQGPLTVPLKTNGAH